VRELPIPDPDRVKCWSDEGRRGSCFQRRDDLNNKYKGACPWNPMIMGHEGAGTWRRSARNVAQVRKGDKSA